MGFTPSSGTVIAVPLSGAIRTETGVRLPYEAMILESAPRLTTIVLITWAGVNPRSSAASSRDDTGPCLTTRCARSARRGSMRAGLSLGSTAEGIRRL